MGAGIQRWWRPADAYERACAEERARHHVELARAIAMPSVVPIPDRTSRRGAYARFWQRFWGERWGRP